MKTFYIAFSLLLFTNFSKSQSYIPFPQDSAQWYTEHVYFNGGSSYEYYNYRFYLDGDTILNNKMYSRLYSTEYGYMGGIREENKNIYISPKSTSIGMWGYEFETTSDNLLYTFDSLYIGKTFTLNSYLLTVANIDSVQFDGVYYKRYFITGSPIVFQEHWIEGIGSDVELLSNYLEFPEFEQFHCTLCFEPNPNTVYHLWPYMDYCAYHVGTDDIQPTTIQITPNPASRVISITAETQENNVTITNRLGTVILNSNFPKEIVIDISSYSAGLYLISIINDKGIFTGKFIKK